MSPANKHGADDKRFVSRDLYKQVIKSNAAIPGAKMKSCKRSLSQGKTFQLTEIQTVHHNNAATRVHCANSAEGDVPLSDWYAFAVIAPAIKSKSLVTGEK